VVLVVQERYKRAQQRVKAPLNFYVWVGIYVVVNVFLLIDNLITDPYNLWFYWPMLGGALLLAISAIPVFGLGRGGRSGKSGRSWNARGRPLR
jgi:two-component system, LytTR family, sensor kinase